MTEKNTPMDTAVPEFWNVERMPEAAPRCRAGTLPMIEEELGAANIPLPIPFAAMSSAKAGKGERFPVAVTNSLYVKAYFAAPASLLPFGGI